MIHDDQRDGEQDANETFIRCQVPDTPHTYFKTATFPTLFCSNHDLNNLLFLLDNPLYPPFTFHLRMFNQQWYLEVRQGWPVCSSQVVLGFSRISYTNLYTHHTEFCMLDRLSSCSASFPKSRTSIKVNSAQLPVHFVVGLHFQTQRIIISGEKMGGVSQNYFCKTAIYTQNFHYKGKGGKREQ